MAKELNNTRKAQIDLVIFNRVPKCGTQSMNQLIAKLGDYNLFATSRNEPAGKERIFLKDDERNAWIADISLISRPHIYNQHIAYINFTTINMPKPIYINMVRDPVERIISWYYYVRADWRNNSIKKKFGTKALPALSQELMEMDLDECVRKKLKECTYEQDGTFNPDHRSQVLFFCGQDRKLCSLFNNQAAMQRAKHTVEQEYAVVGTWEYTNVTLSVFELYIPRYFRNAKDIYYLEQERFVNINRNHDKKPVSEETRAMLRQNLTHEIEFYEFCKQRLYKQYAAIHVAYTDDDEYDLSFSDSDEIESDNKDYEETEKST